MGNILGLDAPITTKVSERGEANGLKFAVSSMQGWRVRMEDEHSLVGEIQSPPGLRNLSLFAVYDGHGGNFTSHYAGNHFVNVFSARKEVREYALMSQTDRDDVPGLSLLKAGLVNAFFEIDEKIKVARGVAGRQNDRSGSTIVVVVITPKHLVCANAGDSRACFRRDGIAKPLSFDHKPNEPVELSRIVNAGGFVRIKRVDGDLAVSRALGDFQYKNRPNLPAELQKVTALPDVIVYPRDYSKDEFILLACDGIWDVLSNQQCCESVQKILDEGEHDLELICEEMLDLCLERNSRDNMTMLMVALPGCKWNSAGGGGVMARRALRAPRDVNVKSNDSSSSSSSSATNPVTMRLPTPHLAVFSGKKPVSATAILNVPESSRKDY